ncbi:MAG: hypothetical protein KDI04_05365 [Halieaceae bacterium]|nr:hypothetical protein [Halieaceae bacterium]MCP5146539.1 hypothetical protein [Pseudomonadales bacterium]MCP5166443.1 hypothetical protein [Pseudomonadales bacterium]MCP5186337.1 hypothetical protein [Pseudomonadales bacterium]
MFSIAPIRFALLTLFSLWALCTAGCGSTPQPRHVPNQPPTEVNFSGFWELDYSQSDNIQAKLDSLVRDLRKQSAQRAGAAGVYQQPTAGVIIGGPGGTNSGTSIIGLAQMADLVTQSQLLEIEQDTHDIKVKREEDYALTCEFFAGQYHTLETPLGKEICGWDGHQLIFKTILPEGLTIQQVLTMGADRRRLNIATTVISDRVTSPFTVNRVYNRYQPTDSGYSCKMTISRGRVCTTEKQ